MTVVLNGVTAIRKAKNAMFLAEPPARLHHP
jgi:hypothetical protein